MSITYTYVQWNRHKKVYDLALAAAVVLLVGAFFGVGKLVWRGEHGLSDEVLLIRSLALCGLVLLNVILWIGPLARLSDRWAPLLYNRRHLGVTMCVVALAHAALATGYYGGFSGRNPLVMVLSSGSARSISGFPFEWVGLAALLVLVVMAATSHDFWLKNLTPRVWKWLHMLVYGAYGAIVLHVVLGALQSERRVGLAAALFGGATITAVLHGAAAWQGRRRESAVAKERDGWVDAAGVDEIPDGRAKVVHLAHGEPVAVFRHEDSFSAITNVCAHQGGPLGEGRIVSGCVTCPWHGYQYLAHNGQSPPPYTEKIATYEVRVRGERVEVRAQALPPGTPVEPARCARAAAAKERS